MLKAVTLRINKTRIILKAQRTAVIAMATDLIRPPITALLL